MSETNAPGVTTDIAGLANLVGTHLGFTDWREMSQERVNQFADVTDDHQFIHVDPGAREGDAVRRHGRPRVPDRRAARTDQRSAADRHRRRRWASTTGSTVSASRLRCRSGAVPRRRRVTAVTEVPGGAQVK